MPIALSASSPPHARVRAARGARLRRALTLALALAAILLGTSPALAQTFNTGGTVTWYSVGDGSGTACQMGATPLATAPFGLTAAISEADWNGSEACGQFIEIRTTASSCAGASPACASNGQLTGDPVIVQITDLCPLTTCPSGRFDLSPAAFEVLAPTSVGIISDVEWRPVHGIFPGNVRVRTQSGSNQFFELLTPLDQNVTVAKLEVTSALLGG